MKKVLSVLLSLVMAVTSLTMATGVFAADAKTAKVEFSVYDGGLFTMEPTVITASADLSDKFEEVIGYNDTSKDVTVYDAVIAAHIYMFGDDFMSYAPIEYSNGILKQSFGEETTALTYRINGAVDDGTGNYYNLETTLKDGDSVEYMFYQDNQFYGDKYTRFDKRNTYLQFGESLTLSLTVEVYDENWNTVVLPAANMTVTVNGEEAGKTDKDGKFTYKPASIGTYNLSAKGRYSDNYANYEIFAPWCTVNVCNHNYSSIIIQDASCTADGLALLTCSICGYEQSSIILAYGHKKQIDHGQPATCTEDGLSEGSHCSVCGKIINEQSVIKAKGHNYQTKHTPPTCTKQGQTEYRCLNCDYTYIEYEDILEHDWTDWQLISKPYSCNNGVFVRICNNCDKIEKKEIPATANHTIVTDKAVPATDTTEGKTEGSHCSVCGEILVVQKTIPKLQKKPNTLAVTAKKPSVKFKKLKKKKQSIALKKWATVSNAKGTVSFKKLKGNKKITVAKNGKITLKKGMKKGTYKIKIQVTAAGNSEYNASVKTVTVKIKVK